MSGPSATAVSVIKVEDSECEVVEYAWRAVRRDELEQQRDMVKLLKMEQARQAALTEAQSKKFETAMQKLFTTMQEILTPRQWFDEVRDYIVL